MNDEKTKRASRSMKLTKYHSDGEERTAVDLPDGTTWVPGKNKRYICLTKYRPQYDALYRRFTRAYIAKLTGNAESAAKHFEASMMAIGKHYFIGDVITERVRRHFRNKYLELLNALKRVDATTSSGNDNHETV